LSGNSLESYSLNPRKYGFSTLGIIALKSFAKMKLSLGKTSEKRTVFVSMKREVVTAPTDGELLWINPPQLLHGRKHKLCICSCKNSR